MSGGRRLQAEVIPSTKAEGGNELGYSEGRAAGARLMRGRGRGVRLRGRQELAGIVGCLDFILSVMGNLWKVFNRSTTGSDYL